MSRDDEVRKVVAQLDGLLDALRDNVGELTAILAAQDQDDQEGAPA